MNTYLLMYKLSKYQYLLSIDPSNSELYNAKISYYKNQLGGSNECSIQNILTKKPEKIFYDTKKYNNLQNACYLDGTRLDIILKKKQIEEKRIKEVDTTPTTSKGHMLRWEINNKNKIKISELNKEIIETHRKIKNCYKYIEEHECNNKIY